jgi:hypothetical protein
VRRQQATTPDYNTLHLRPDDDQTDFITKNLNAFVKQNMAFDLSEAPTKSTPLQTIVEVINPVLVGDGSVNRIAVGRSTDQDYPSFGYGGEEDDDDDDDDSDSESRLLASAVVDQVTYRRRQTDAGGFPLSINDKMKNVLKELKQNERVRLSLSRSIDVDDVDFGSPEQEEEEDDEEDEPLSGVYEERTGTNGTVFLVRERLINDFYEHEEDVSNRNGHKISTTVASLLSDNFNPANFTVGVDNCQIYKNPNVDDFLYDESDKQKLQEDLKNDLEVQTPTVLMTVTETTAVTEVPEEVAVAEEDDEEPTTPSHTTGTANSTTKKKNKRKGKNKRK